MVVPGALAGLLQIWAAFIAWGCFFHSGGKEAALRSTIVCTVAGAIVAWITLLIVTRTGLADAVGLSVWAVVGVGVGVMVLLANIPALATIPAQVYGFASIAGYTLVGGKVAELTAASIGNPLLTIGLSLIIGALFGYLSEKLAGAMTAEGAATAH